MNKLSPFRENLSVFSWSLRLLLLVLFLGPGEGIAGNSQMSGSDVNMTLRAAVVRDLLEGDENLLAREGVIDVELMKSLVPLRLDPALLGCGLEPGISLHFRRPGREKKGKIANYILVCRDDAMAQAMTKRKIMQRGYFKSKILTLFSWVRIGRRVVIVFTETARDEVTVKWVESVQQVFNVRND